MRIHSINSIAQLYQANQASRYNKSNQKSSVDSLEISSEAKDFQSTLNAVKASDDIRAERVEEIKKQMEAGTYQVSNKEIAEKMAERFFNNIHPIK